MRPGKSAAVRTRSLAAALALLLPAALCVGDSKADSQADSKAVSCRRFVQQFYTWYAAKCEKGFSAEDAVKARPQSFNPAIVRALRENEAESKKHPGEIVGLDFDPIVNSQDLAQKYNAGPAKAQFDRYLVPVYAVYDGKRSDVPAVIPEVRWAGGHWRFEEFHYRNDPKKPEETFSHMMEGFRREWRKEAGHAKRRK